MPRKRSSTPACGPDGQQYRAFFDQSVATYRQTVLVAFQQVEDGLAGLRILSAQIQQQDQAVQASDRFVKIATNRFKVGIDPYLNVLTAQISLLGNQQTEVNLKIQRMTTSVQLVEALGGGWDSSAIPGDKELLSDPPKAKPTAPASVPPKGSPPLTPP